MSHYMKQFKFQNFIVFVLMTLDGILSISAAVFTINILNSLIARNFRQFVFWVVLTILTWVIDSFVQGIRDVQREKVLQDMLNSVREDILNPLTQMTYAEFQKNSKDDYNSWLTNDMNLLYGNGFSQIYWAYEGIICMLFSAITIIYLHWALLVATVFLGIFLYIFPTVFQKRLTRETQLVSEVSTDSLGTSTDYLNGYEVLFQDNQLGYFKQKILTAFYRLKDAKVRLVKIQAFMSYSLLSASMVSNLIVFMVAGYLIYIHQISTGVIFSISTLSGYVMNYSKNVANNFITLRATTELMGKYPKMAEQPEQSINTAPAHFANELTVKNLAITFQNGHEIHYPDFTIYKGWKYAIVGDSGSGKSTLINLLAGTLTDYTGQIMMDGKDYRTLSLSSLRENISLVAQFPYLFRETLHENLTIGREISPDIFAQSLTLAQADDFIADKLAVPFDENLSSGQQERLSIARELMGAKPILILDESTANLDKATALAIEQNILQDESLTVLMITHHLSDESRALVDEIIAL